MAYKDNITYIGTTPISKKNAGFFVSYPTIVSIGHGINGMQGFFVEERKSMFKPFIAHELGHYYFGSVLKPNSELGNMINEAFAEYMSCKVTQEFFDKSVYKAKVDAKIKGLKDEKKLKAIKEKYFESDNSTENAILAVAGAKSLKENSTCIQSSETF